MFISTVDPIAFSLGPVTFRWYGLLFSGGFIIGYFIMQYMFKLKHYKSEDLDKLLMVIFIGTVLGARLGHCFIYEPDFYLAHPIEILKIWKGGLASHGGGLGVLIALLIFVRGKQYTFFELTDMLSAPIALVGCLIRIGNFANSEILGIPTNSDYGVVFARIGENFPRHPAQLYEACAYFLTFICLLTLYFAWKKRPQGTLFGVFFTLIFGARFLIEPLKTEQADYSTGTIFTVGQYLSLPFILLGIVTFIWAFYSHRKGQ